MEFRRVLFRSRAGLEAVDRELLVELAVRDACARIGDALGLVLVEEAELGVHERRGRLDAAEPARHGNRNRLSRDTKIGDCLGRLASPELPLGLGPGHATTLA